MQTYVNSHVCMHLYVSLHLKNYRNEALACTYRAHLRMQSNRMQYIVMYIRLFKSGHHYICEDAQIILSNMCTCLSESKQPCTPI